MESSYSYKSDTVSIREGEFSIFYTKFTEMGERLNKALVDFKNEKVNLKDIITNNFTKRKKMYWEF